MYILALETTGERASAALIDERGNVSEESSAARMNHLQSLMPMTKTLLEKGGLCVKDISCIAASQGPGSFTGIRIGVSTARAMAQILNVPTIGVPTLKAFAYNEEGCEETICPILDARRNQVYGGAYRWTKEGKIEETVTAGAYDLAEYLHLLEKMHGAPFLFFGDGVKVHQERIQQWQRESPNDNIRLSFAENGKRAQTALSVAKLALVLYEAGEACGYEELKPVYLRKAEAERKLEAGLLQRKG